MIQTNQGDFSAFLIYSNMAFLNGSSTGVYKISIPDGRGTGVRTAICHEITLYIDIRVHGDIWVWFRHDQLNGPDCTTVDMHAIVNIYLRIHLESTTDV